MWKIDIYRPFLSDSRQDKNSYCVVPLLGRVVERKWSELACCQHQPAYAGVYPWYNALDLWEMDCWGRSATPILRSRHFSHYVLLIRWVGGTRAWTRDLLIRSPELYRLSYARASRFNKKKSILTFFQTIGDPIPPSPNAVETPNHRGNNSAPTGLSQDLSSPPTIKKS